MIFNNINLLNKYDCIITERNIQSAQVFTFNVWLERAPASTKLRDEQYKYTPVTVKLLVEGKSEDEILTKISNIIKDATSGELKFTDLSYSFNANIENHESNLIYDKAYTLTLEYKCDYKMKPEVTEIVSNSTSKNITNMGNLKAPVLMTITSPIDQISASIGGLTETPIVIKNLKANQVITINYDNGSVVAGGSNKFNDVDMWEFPTLKAGTSAVTVDRNNLTITLKYKPRFI